jgi:hypothetical protein
MFTPHSSAAETPSAEYRLSESLKSSIEMAIYVLANSPDTLEGLSHAKASAAFILGEAFREADTGQIELH